MINGMYLSTMGAMIQSARHAILANNLANAHTPGFKPEMPIFRHVPAESVLLGQHRREVDAILEKTGGGAWIDQVVANFAPGSIQPTGSPLHAALGGRDSLIRFFMVSPNPGGEPIYYTRDGSFTRNAQGQLVTSTGAYVLGPNGEPLVIPTQAQPRIEADGTIKDVAQNPPVVLGQIGVMGTTEPQKLRKIGDNLYAADNVTMVSAQSEVVGGALEQSATSGLQEMVEMIEGHRTYEANMTFLRMQDDTLGDTVRRLGVIA